MLENLENLLDTNIPFQSEKEKRKGIILLYLVGILVLFILGV